MDEPFGALDAITRDAMSQSLLEIWQRTGKTIVLVTHSIDEAIYLSSQVHVLGIRPGRIIETLDIGLPYPRDDGVMELPEFTALERRLRNGLRASHGPGPMSAVARRASAAASSTSQRLSRRTLAAGGDPGARARLRVGSRRAALLDLRLHHAGAERDRAGAGPRMAARSRRRRS